MKKKRTGGAYFSAEDLFLRCLKNCSGVFLGWSVHPQKILKMNKYLRPTGQKYFLSNLV